MAIFGGFMTIVSILGFFLTVIWFLLPFVIFSMKGKVDRSVEILEDIDRRLAALEARSRSTEVAAIDPAEELTVEGGPEASEPYTPPTPATKEPSE